MAARRGKNGIPTSQMGPVEEKQHSKKQRQILGQKLTRQLRANPAARQTAPAATTDTGGQRQARRDRFYSNPENAEKVRKINRKRAEESLTKERKQQDAAERAGWVAGTAHRSLSEALPDRQRAARELARASIPITAENETTGNLARTGMVEARMAPTMRALETLKQAAIQPSVQDSPYQQIGKSVQRSGPYAAMPVVPLVQSLVGAFSHGEEHEPSTDLERGAQGLLADASRSNASSGYGDALQMLAMVNSMAGDIMAAKPLLHATRLGKVGHGVRDAAGDFATRRVAPAFAEYGAEQMGRGAARVIPRAAEVGYEAGVHFPVWATEKILHAAHGAPAAAGAAAIAPALSEYGVRIPEPPQVIRRGY